MTQIWVAHAHHEDSVAAGQHLSSQIREALGNQEPDAVILFASPRFDFDRLLRALHDGCRPRYLVGCSSAGEFSTPTSQQGTACAMAIHSPSMRFAAGVGRNLRSGRALAARSLVSTFRGPTEPEFAYRAAMILTDALAGYADEFIEQVNLATGGVYQLFGGGAGDDAKFQKTHVFFGTESVPDAAVALEILSHKPIGIGVCHGWEPATPAMRVTQAEAMRLVSLNAVPVAEVFREHAKLTKQQFDPQAPLPFFLHNVLGVHVNHGYKLRVPLAIHEDNSVSCAAEIPEGSLVSIMKATSASAAEAAREATRAAVRQLGGQTPKAAIFFDCVATRLRTGREFGIELQALRENLGDAAFAGCNTYGQIARAEGQFNGFHNCTAVIGVFPE